MSKALSLNIKDVKKTVRDSAFYGALCTVATVTYPLFNQFLSASLQGISTMDLSVYGAYGTAIVALSQLLLRFIKTRK